MLSFDAFALLSLFVEQLVLIKNDYLCEIKKIKIMAVLTQELTYEEIHRLKAEQERLIAAGEMERPKIRYGFSPEGRKAFEEGIPMEEVFAKLEKRYNIKIG
jgi:hypothetical protein